MGLLLFQFFEDLSSHNNIDFREKFLVFIMDHKCVLCAFQAKLCAACKSITDCSPESQQANWPVHKILCKKLVTFEAENPCPQGGLLCISFPANENLPKLVWVVYGSKLGTLLPIALPTLSWKLNLTFVLEGGGGGYDSTNVESFLGGRSVSRPAMGDNCYRSILVDGHTVLLQGLENCEKNDSEFNACATELTKGPAAARYPGPALLLSHTGEPDDPDVVCHDITLGDFCVAVDYFKWMGAVRVISERVQSPVDPSAQVAAYNAQLKPRYGVKLLCDGDQEAARNRSFIAIRIPHDHPVYKSQPTDISKAMGLPLQNWQYPPNLGQGPQLAKSPRKSSRNGHELGHRPYKPELGSAISEVAVEGRISVDCESGWQGFNRLARTDVGNLPRISFAAEDSKYFGWSSVDRYASRKGTWS